MEEKIFELASTQGIWAVISVGLIFYILKNQEKRDLRQEDRENKYQEIIRNLTDKLNLVEDVKKDVEDIKNYVFKKNA
ncbi:MAG: BhlA/UviB family holin-like peptide [Marinisporobacter sp.]|nr:BhlA/UviB family holin-like peptide [Marinisporobacter sp.]